MSYDIIIPTAQKDIVFLPKVIKYIRLNLKDAERIYVITEESNFKKIRKIQQKDANVVAINENTIVPGLSYTAVKQAMLSRCKNPLRVGWFFQQLLKMGFAFSDYCRDYYLSWDADTLPLVSICFFEGETPIFTKKYEYNKLYFDTMEKLTGFTKTVDFSFIAEHMMFKKEFMQELLCEISKCSVKGETWVQKCINASVDLNLPSFSEFETYGTFVWNKYPGFYKTQRLNTFRSAGFIKGRWIDDKTLKTISFDIDIASFEMFHEPLFPYNIPNILYRWRKKINKLMQLSIVEFFPFLYNHFRVKISKKRKNIHEFEYRYSKK